MTDRFNRLTVVLDNDMRDDDTENILTAIKMVKGVHSVVGVVSDDMSLLVAELRIKRELRDKMLEVLS